jgi:hypothetical protein
VFLFQFQEVTLSRGKKCLRPACKQGSKSSDVVKYDAISLHKVIAYKCEQAKGGYVFICSCIRFQVCHSLFFKLILTTLRLSMFNSYMFHVGKRMYM